MYYLEKEYRGKADISGACKAAPVSQLPAVAFCRQSEEKQQEQQVSQLLCSVVRTAVKLSRIIWFVLLLLLQQSWGAQLKQALAAGRGLGEPFAKGLRTHRCRIKRQEQQNFPRPQPRDCGAEIEGRDYKSGKKGFTLSREGKQRGFKCIRHPNT